MSEYLDKTGLTHFWSKVKSALSNFYTKQETANLIASNFATISTTIADGSSSSQATRALIGGDHQTEIIPSNGYYISAVTVTMGGVDITASVFTGTEV